VIKFSKDYISIKNIGKQRFWIGVIAGLVTAISISLFFNYFREVFRLLTCLNDDLLILNRSELLFYNFFFSSLSSVFGLSITIWIWMSNANHACRRHSIYKQFSRTYVLLGFWMILMIVSRFGSILPIVLKTGSEYLNLYEDFWFMFVLFPVVVFAQSWFTVRRIYKAGKWILLSFILCIFISLIISLTTNPDREILNKIYFNKYTKDYEYIDMEIMRAKEKYNIVFDESTIEALKKWHSVSSNNQIDNIKRSFEKNSKVSLDTIILQKIVIHNLKQGEWRYSKWGSIERWRYALPNDVFKQLIYFERTEQEKEELFNILKEQIELINMPEIEWSTYKEYTVTERRRAMYVRHELPIPIVTQLIAVRDSIVRSDKYSEYFSILPDIKIDRRTD